MPKSRAILPSRGAISSVVERFLHTEEATGSIPVSPTIFSLLARISWYPMRNAPKAEILDRTQEVSYTLMVDVVVRGHVEVLEPSEVLL